MTFPRGIDKTRNTEPYQSLPDKYSYIEFHDHVPKIWYGVSLEMSLRNLNITLNWLFSDVVPSSNQKLKLLIRTSRHAALYTFVALCVFHSPLSILMSHMECLPIPVSRAYQPPAQSLPHLTQYIIHKLTNSLTGSQSEQSKCATNGSWNQRSQKQRLPYWLL